MTALFLLIALVCVFLPIAEVATALPALWLLQTTVLGTDAALFTAGPVDVTAADLVLLGLLGKLAFAVLRDRDLPTDGPLYAALALFLVVNLLATLAAGVKFGSAPMSRGITSLARLCIEMSVIPILALSVRSLPQARRCATIVFGILAILAVIQFVNFFGASRGIVIGEVQGLERGEPRYFGPVGDSIGPVLLLGYLASLCLPSVLGIGGFAGGIVLTAGLGAITTTGVGTLLFLVFGIRAEMARRFFLRFFWAIPGLAFAALVAVLTVGQPLAQTLLDRLGEGNYSASASQRMANVTLATNMITDNPLTGVGFLGFEAALPLYGGEKFFNLSLSDGATANANNQILQSLSDAGLPGLLVFLGVVFCAARLLHSVAQRCTDRILATYFLASFIWLLAQLFGNLAAVWLLPSSYVARFLWIALGCAVAVRRLLDDAEARGPALATPEDSESRLLPA